MDTRKIGLQRNTVSIVPYDSQWTLSFNEVKLQLQHILSVYNPDIQHVGSTSVKGLDSKPIVDVAVGLENLNELDSIIVLMEEYNFQFRKDNQDRGGYLFVRSIGNEIRTHHIHILKKEGELWDNYLFFRNSLRENDALKEKYQSLKNELALLYPLDRGAYTEGKATFIKNVLSEKNNKSSEK